MHPKVIRTHDHDNFSSLNLHVRDESVCNSIIFSVINIEQTPSTCSNFGNLNNFYHDSPETNMKLHPNHVFCSLSYTVMYLSRKGLWFWLHLRLRLWFWFRLWLTPLHLRGWFPSWWPRLSWRGWRACPFLESGFLILSLTNEGFCFLAITTPNS